MEAAALKTRDAERTRTEHLKRLDELEALGKTLVEGRDGHAKDDDTKFRQVEGWFREVQTVIRKIDGHSEFRLTDLPS